jgi:large subunit ribosomal protein L12
MEYVYAALLLHKAGKQVDEASIKKVLEAADVKVEPA